MCDEDTVSLKSEQRNRSLGTTWRTMTTRSIGARMQCKYATRASDAALQISNAKQRGRAVQPPAYCPVNAENPCVEAVQGRVPGPEGLRQIRSG